MKKTLIATLLIFSNFIFAQVYTEATLYLRDGTKLEGYATIPDGPFDSGISFKNTMEDRSKIIPSKTIQTATYQTIKKQKLVFERYASVYWKKDKNGAVISKNAGKEQWFWLDKSHEKLNLYLSYIGYKLYKNGDFYFKTINNSEAAFYFRRPNEAVVTNPRPLTLSLKVLYENLGIYFSDVEDLVKRINNNEFYYSEIKGAKKLYEAYLNY